MPRILRYLAPNLVTMTGLIFGLMSMVATSEARFVDAGLLIIWAVMLDRMDGLVARTLDATSPFGVQMDSFADAINFGIAPSFLIYTMLSSVPALGFDEGFGRGLLLGACALWVLATVFRLAKFNVVAESDAPPDVFLGVPTTLAAGLLVIWVLVLLEYPAPGTALGNPMEQMLRDLAGQQPDPAVTDRLGRLLLAAQVGSLLDHRIAQLAVGGWDTSAEASARKLIGVRYRQALEEFRMDLSPGAGLVLNPAVESFLNTRCLSIAGGTEQILLTMAGERLLGLPR